MKRFIILAALLVASCGPVYDTQVTFVPPDTDAGRACVFQCDNTQLQCRQLKDSQALNTNLIRQQERTACMARETAKKNPYANLACSISEEQASYGQCTAQYEQCYSTCGGQVQKKTVCVSGC